MWLGKKPTVATAQHDAHGGAEAIMNLQLEAEETKVRVQFSRLYRLNNRYRIDCERATIEGRLFAPAEFQIVRDGRTRLARMGPSYRYQHYAQKLITNFLNVVAGIEQPLFVANDVADSIAVIEEAYQKGVPIQAPWYQIDPNTSWLTGAVCSAPPNSSWEKAS
jgi:hypothetical protein